MASLINLTAEQQSKILKQRHRRGAVHENLYRMSLVVAVVALIILLIQVSNNAFGPVLAVPVKLPTDIADTPLNQLDEETLATILVEELGGEFLNLFRDNYGRVAGIDFLTVPISQSLRGSTLPDDLVPQADQLSYNDLNTDQLAAILVLNSNQVQLLKWIESEVVGEDIIGEWGWITWVLNRNSVYIESGEELAPDIARAAIRAAGDDATVESITEQLIPSIGATFAAQFAEDYFAVQSTLLDTDWKSVIDFEKVRSDVTVELNRSRTSVSANLITDRVEIEIRSEVATHLVTETGIEPAVAETIAIEFAGDLTEELVIAEISSSGLRDILAPMVAPAMAEVLKVNQYNAGEVTFRSWLTPGFLIARGQNSVPELASLRTAILGSVWVMIITMLTAFPLGVGAAIYLEEYAVDNTVNRIIETNIRNLAGVPSIIYGLLGLAVFVRAVAPFTSGSFLISTGADPATLNGRTVMSAGLTLALLILPVIIINSQEAIRAVPSTIREASYGIGATKWQTIWRQVLPAAVPGILTGTILSFSRAVGETAPLIVVGASTAINADPTLFSKFTVIPIQIFNWTEESRPEYQHLAAAAIIVLLFLLIALNTTAIVLRNRYSRR